MVGEYSDSSIKMIDNMSSYSYQSNTSTFINQQMQITTLVMGDLNKSYLIKLSLNIATFLLQILSKIFILSAIIHYLGPELGDTYAVLEALGLVGHIAISLTFSEVASRNIEKYQQLQQINPCNYVFTYGIVLQVLSSLIVGIVLAVTIPFFINVEKITPTYSYIKFIVQPVTFSLGPAFSRFLDTDGSLLFHLYIVKPVIVLLCISIMFLIAEVYQSTSPIIIVVAELVPEAIYTIITLFLIFKKNGFTSLKFEIKFFKQFNPAIIGRLFKQSFVTYWMVIEDWIIYFPTMYIIMYKEFANQSPIRLLYYQYLTRLSCVVYNASLSLTRTYSRINNQVQRYDRLYLMIKLTFKYIFLIQFIYACLIFLISDYLYDFIYVEEESSSSMLQITKYGAIKGLICSFGTAVTIIQAVFQIILAAFQTKSKDLLSCCISVELFSSIVDACLYVIALKIFRTHRENTVYNVVENQSVNSSSKELKAQKTKSRSNESDSGEVSGEQELLQPEPEMSKAIESSRTGLHQIKFEEIDECYFDPETFIEFMQDSCPDEDEEDEDNAPLATINEVEEGKQVPKDNNIVKSKEGMQLVINNVAEHVENIE